MTVKEFLRNTYIVNRKFDLQEIRPHVLCADGYEISIQAGRCAYSIPRENDIEFDAVELGYPNMTDELIEKYAEDPGSPTSCIYPYVPVDIVEVLMEKHGGIVELVEV